MADLSRLTSGKIVPAEFLEILQRIVELYPGEVDIATLDSQWATLGTKTKVETQVLKDMMADEKKIFLKDQINRFQVLCRWACGRRALWVGYFGYSPVPPPGPGFWWL